MSIDFTDADTLDQLQRDRRKRHLDAKDVQAQLIPRAEDFVRRLMPHMILHPSRAYAEIGDIHGTPGRSLKIQLTGPKAGQWFDHATGEGGDLLDLYAAVMDIKNDFPRVLTEISEQFLGHTVPRWTKPNRERIEQRAKENAAKPKPEIEAGLPPPSETYRYIGLDGNLIALVWRYELDEINPETGKREKTFRPWNPATSRMQMPDKRPLYRLPEISKADTVVFTEGEGKANALAAIGIAATSLMGGCKTPLNKADLKPLTGKSVILWPDNDDGGKAFMAELATHLMALGCTLRLVQIPEGKPEKWDAADCIAEGGNAAKLIEEAESLTTDNTANNTSDTSSTSNTSGTNNTGTNNNTNRFPLVAFDDLIPGTEPEYAVYGVIPRTGIVVFWGPPKCGKSFVVFDLMCHVALGWLYRSRAVEQGLVVYCAFEGAHGYLKRAAAFRRKHADYNKNGRVPFYLMPMRLDLIKDHPALLADLRQQLGAQQPTAVVLDTLNRSLVGSENSDEDMSNYVDAADAIRKAFNCVVIIVHHCGVAGDRPRGHTSLGGAVDAQLKVSRDAADLITTTVEWMKDGPEGDEIVSRLEPVDLGADDKGNPMSSCVVVPVIDLNTAKTKPEIKLAPTPRAALKTLFQCCGDIGHGYVGPANDHVPNGVRGVTFEEWRHMLQCDGIISKEGNPREQFRRIHVTLKNAYAIGVWDGFVWPVT